MEVSINGREVITMVIVGIYAPTEDSTSVEKDDLWNRLTQVIEDTPRRKEIFIMGDMNGRVGRGEDSKVVGKFGEEIRNDNGTRLIGLCEQFELKINNTFFAHKNIHEFTWC